jgi:hypothetical protein
MLEDSCRHDTILRKTRCQDRLAGVSRGRFHLCTVSIALTPLHRRTK